MPLDLQDQLLISTMANKIVHLYAVVEGITKLLIAKGGVTNTELRAAVQDAMKRQRDSLRQSQQSSEELLEDFLRKFEGPQQ